MGQVSDTPEIMNFETGNIPKYMIVDAEKALRQRINDLEKKRKNDSEKSLLIVLHEVHQTIVRIHLDAPENPKSSEQNWTKCNMPKLYLSIIGQSASRYKDAFSELLSYLHNELGIEVGLEEQSS